MRKNFGWFEEHLEAWIEDLELFLYLEYLGLNRENTFDFGNDWDDGRRWRDWWLKVYKDDLCIENGVLIMVFWGFNCLIK